MAQQVHAPTTRDEIRRAAAVSIVLAGTAVAALAAATYLARRQGREIGIAPSAGVSAASVEAWLRNAADKLQNGSQAILSDLDQKR